MQSLLTTSQKATLWDSEGKVLGNGYIKLTARPGTGKTHTLTHYCIDISKVWSDTHSPWQGMGVLSYTNVAKREIQKRITEMAIGYELLNYPHYIGTLDSFINNYIFLPFGSRLMGCSERPVLIGEPFTSGKSVNETKKNRAGGIAYFDHYYYSYHSSYGLDNKLFLVGYQKEVEPNGAINYYDSIGLVNKLSSWIKVNGEYGIYAKKVHDEKQLRFSKGYATQADSNYFAYRLLSEFEDIRNMIIERFPSILVDEAQDMTEIQHAIIDLLCSPKKDKLTSCILIGDDAQAIYEWNTARPDLFANKKGFVDKELTETFRCSKDICDLLNKLDNARPLIPAGKNRHYDDKVQTRDWGLGEKSDLKKVIDEFVNVLSNKEPHDDSSDYINLAVLARSKKLASHAINAYLDVPESDFGHFTRFNDASTKDLLRVVYCLNPRNGSIFKAFNAYEMYWRNKYDLKTVDATKEHIGRMMFGENDYDLNDYRQGIYVYLEKLKKLTHEFLNVSDFDNISLKVLDRNGFPDIDNNIADIKGFTGRNKGDFSLEALFANALDEKMPHIIQAANGRTVHISIGTIHSVKGETYDGVLYLSKDNTEFCKNICPKKKNGTKTRDWKDIIKHDILKCESKRLLYVALSRAAQSLWLAGSGRFISLLEE